jgi:hypothetical protein
LLQPLADGIADRPAGLAIDLFESAADSAIHLEFPGEFLCPAGVRSRKVKSEA